MKQWTLVCLTILLSGCAVDRGHLDEAVSMCCRPGNYETFSVYTNDIPVFLEALMVNSFMVALAAHDVTPVDEGGDLIVNLSFEQINLSPDRTRDDFEERIAFGDGMRFIARIMIDIRDRRSGEPVFSGHIQRLHDVGAGDWMHTGRASSAILESFNQVLEGWPER